jgi:prepilin-type processing-associated H-X9-DG protein
LGLGGHIGHPDFGEVKDIRVRFPSEMVAIADSKSDLNWDTALDPSDAADAEYPSKRHFDGANVVFADGHARLEFQRNLTEASDQARRRWNNDGLPHREYWP